jgi:hypothetical protein
MPPRIRTDNGAPFAGTGLFGLSKLSLGWMKPSAAVVLRRGVKTGGNLVVQTLMRALVVEHIAKAIEAALLCSKGCRGWFGRVLLQSAMHPLVAAVLLWPTRLNALMHDPEDRCVAKTHQTDY